MTTTTGLYPVGALDRAEILRYASCLLAAADRTPAAVTEAAGPLLQWAAEAWSRSELRARMNALHRAFTNDQARLSAAIALQPRLTPAQFLDEARAYYLFITADGT